MIQTILVPAPGYASDNAALETALLAARPFGAHIDALHVRPDWAQIASRAIPPDLISGVQSERYFEALEKEAKSLTWRANRHVAEFCSRRSIALNAKSSNGAASVSWRAVEGDMAGTVIAESRFHDLVVASRGPDSTPLAPAGIGTILLASGRPLILAPEKPTENIGARLAIAWKDTREAAHAVTAAMPFLLKANEVVVLAAEENGPHPTENSAERVAAQLRGHGIDARAQTVPLCNEIADTLVRGAVNAGADMLVMGAYGRNRVTEYVLGGATRGVLLGCPLPVFLCH